MIAEERMGRIVSMVEERGVVTVPEIMEELEASESTVRRDLCKLDAQGLLNKVHGGATRKDDTLRQDLYITADQSLAGRHELNMAEKRAIAEHAASLISPHDFVYIDGGTTTECLVDAITETNAIYLTNSLPHAQRLLSKGCRTLLPGGEVKPVTEVLVGAETVNAIRRYYFTIGFWGTNGVGLETGFTTPEFNEAAVKQISLEHTANPYVLCDSSKFSQVSLITFAGFNEATIITDRLPKSEEAYRSAGNVVEVEAQ